MSKFKIPESLTDLDVDGLLDLRSQARKAAADLVADESPSAEDITAAEAIVEFIASADARIAELRDADQKTQDRLAAIRAASEETEGEPGDEDEGDEPEAEPEGDDDDEAEDEEVVVEESVAKESVMASATKTSAVARAAANARPVEAPMNKKGMTITAAADIAGIVSGSELKDSTALTAAAMKRFKSFPKGKKGQGGRIRQGIATIDVGASRTDGMFQGNPDFKTDQDVLVAAASAARLEGGSLVAAGGWCAPSETLYDFCSEVSTDGILSLPSMTVNTGSIRYTQGPDFAAIFANADGDWNLTEAEVIADTEKPCIEVECPDWDELTLDVTGVCVSAGILTNSAYPELVKAYIENVLIAHQHKVAGRLYSSISTASTTLTGVTGITEIDGLGALEMVIEHTKSVKRMNMNEEFEVLLPAWYKASIRRDLANRSGIDPINVSDAQIDAAFRSRNLAVQWLYNTGQDITRAVNALTVPATVNAVFYRPGTFLKLTTDLIELDGIYDSTNIKTNGYTALFSEEGIKLANLCGDGYKIALPVCHMGNAGALDLTCVAP